MAAAPTAARDGYESDLRSALALAGRAHVPKTVQARNNIFGEWSRFCASLRIPPDLRTVTDPETKLCHLLVFGLRYRTSGKTGHPVRAGSVEDALLAVGKGISDLGCPDPRKEAPGSQRNHPLLSSFLKAMRDEDDPASRSYPANITIIRQLFEILDTDHAIHGQANRHAIDLTIVGFFWLLRPAEYLATATTGRSQAFRLQDISFTVQGKLYAAADTALNDLSLDAYEFASLTFNDQKNGVRGEQVGHKATTDDRLCPCKALARLARHLRLHNAPIDSPISTYWDGHGRLHQADSSLITNGLRHAAESLKHLTGIDPSLLSTRSLRPGGATALLCAGVDKDIIQLLGRWKSDAMFRYLRVQATSSSGQYSQRMLDHGTYTFAPQAPSHPGELPVPVQAPPAFLQALATAQATS